MKYKILWVSIIAAALSGCAVTYKGVAVYLDQNTKTTSENGSTASVAVAADKARVPLHQQGSDVAVPLLKEIGSIYSDQLDAALKALKQCRKLLEGGYDFNCDKITMPERPALPVEPPVTLPNPIPPVILPPEIPSEPAEGLPITEAWGSGNLWKPVSESRGGIPAVLTKKGIAQGKLTLHRSNGSVIPTNVEYRGLTNGDRQTYFLLNLKAGDLPSNIRVKIDDRVWLVPDPIKRYD